MNGTGPAPAEYGWWLTSRAAGIVALVCITVAVGVGLLLASKVARRPGWPRVLVAIHEHAALAGLIAIAVHGIALLGDAWLKASIADVAVPFVNEHARVWTGLGVTGGWLAAALGLSFYFRKRIGTRRWRSLHKATILVYVLGVAHTLGSGTDAKEPWMQAFLLVTGAPILYLFVLRILPRESAAPAAAKAPAPRPIRRAEPQVAEEARAA
jgi:sulfoxide reductase heme-binding subunit YedZ